MLSVPVPDFFQDDSEDALRARAHWLAEEMALDDSFFARVLRADETVFTRWKEHGGVLPDGMQEHVREVWEAMLHVLSFLNFDTARARSLLEHVSPANPPRGVTLGLPWAGSSIKSYLQARGPEGLDAVSHWITSFRFGAPSLSAEDEMPCPSTRD